MHQIIQNLISLKQEGSYWDFKKEWYSSEKKSDLLHDIICMANNLDNKDAYIIIGIDEENMHQVSSVVNDKNRKSTQMLVDFLRDKKFSGGIRPIVYVETIIINNGEIDVIVVKNTSNTPYYLNEKYQGVFANNIYTRVMDTNTPKEKSADIHHVEYLWKKRFRLISTPLERAKYYLEKKSEWEGSPSDEAFIKYHKFFPEFTIEHTPDDIRNGYEFYLFNQTDTSPRWYEIRIYYHQTLLFTTGGASLDGGRYFTSTPFTDGISLTSLRRWDISFKYFIKDTIEYTIHEFYFNPDQAEELYSHRSFMECMLVFDSEDEKESFKMYVLSVWHENDKYSQGIFVPDIPEIKRYRSGAFKEEYRNVQILKNIFKEFKNNNTYT
ncbi:AlbA family DNA-binding domain-containing protein [Lysinibacillus sphaericus]|uniref:AlbA family DNA-binding domain-containing protein n=1 Tax=Lysinibacillus sphaericus TaxID=1421 RepID=UPI0018CD345E|nr:ATP-binding protein [Lysinibacillus sphaericus]